MEINSSMEETFFRQVVGVPGTVVIVNHLQSEKGKEMNGRRAVVIGFDPPQEDRRVRVYLLDPNTHEPIGNILRLKPTNTVDSKLYCAVPSKSQILKEDAVRFLKIGVKNALDSGYGHCPKDSDEAGDQYRRTQFVNEFLSDNKLPPDSVCMDFMTDSDNFSELEKIRSSVKPACTGDGFVNFTRFGEGIIGNEDDRDECAICQECLVSDLIRLPCNHRFHLSCVKPWFRDHNSCPTCRYELIHPWKTYIVKIANEQIQKRFDEWLISGMCERCQAAYLENSPIVSVTDHDGRVVIMPLSSAKKQGYDCSHVKSIHGRRMENAKISL